jgi:adenylylsulfate kinase-like enzyme
MTSKIYYIIGQPGSGKTTLAKHLCDNVLTNTHHIDGDDLRNLTQNKDYSEKGRKTNIELAHTMARLSLKDGKNVVISIVSPFKYLRDNFKTEMGNKVIEIFLHTTEIRGREQFHVKDYQVPTDNYINVDTTHQTVIQSINTILNNLN